MASDKNRVVWYMVLVLERLIEDVEIALAEGFYQSTLWLGTLVGV